MAELFAVVEGPTTVPAGADLNPTPEAGAAEIGYSDAVTLRTLLRRKLRRSEDLGM
jgi:hypothetical protein